MVNKKNWLGSFAIMLIWGIVLVYPAKVGADDLWANVPNLDMLNGIWKGSYSKDQTFIEAQGLANSNITLNNDFIKSIQDFVGDIRQISKGEITIIFTSNAKTVSISGTNLNSYSGSINGKTWELEKGFNEIYGVADGITYKYNDANHSINSTYFFLKSYMDPEPDIRFQINQIGTKLKVIFISSGYIKDPQPELKFSLLPRGVEIIMTKQ